MHHRSKVWKVRKSDSRLQNSGDVRKDRDWTGVVKVQRHSAGAKAPAIRFLVPATFGSHKVYRCTEPSTLARFRIFKLDHTRISRRRTRQRDRSSARSLSNQFTVLVATYSTTLWACATACDFLDRKPGRRARRHHWNNGQPTPPEGQAGFQG